MADTSAIEWTDTTWNPTTGCDRVSDGCTNCYALTMAGRLKAMGQAKYRHDGDPRTSGPGFGVAMHADTLTEPYRWRTPRRVFVNSMSDLFHEDVPDGFIARVWEVMAQTPQHTYQILTKRHARMRSWVRRWADRGGDWRADSASGMPPLPRGPEAVRATYTSGRARLFADMLDSMGEPPQGAAYPLYDWMEGPRFWPTVLPNVWIGVSVEDQKWAEIRIPALLETPAAVRFLSCEPLLGPVDLKRAVWTMGSQRGHGLTASFVHAGGCCRRFHGVDWVIVGGESGRGARPMDLDWAESIVTQCADAEVAAFVKQLGSRWGKAHHDIDQFPPALQVRQYPYPEAAHATGGRHG